MKSWVCVCVKRGSGLTSDMVVGAVHHVSSVDEVVAWTFHTELHFIVTQNHLPSEEEKQQT